MSSKLTAISYIHDSGINYWNLRQVTVLKDVIQNIRDGRYNDPSYIPLDIFHFTDPKKIPSKVTIKGISLGDGKTEIYTSKDIEKCIIGVEGKIGIIIEECGQTSTTDFSDIHHITFSKNIMLTQLSDPTVDSIDTLDSSPIGSSAVSQDTHISH